jgi:AcrR family transcriptional regulator
MEFDSRLAAMVAFERKLESANNGRVTPSRQRILEAFLSLSAAHGVQAVSMRMLAKAVMIKPPSIYAHFENGRDEIIADSLRWNFYQFGQAILSSVQPTETPSEFWDAMVRVHFTRQLKLPESNLWDLIIATDRAVRILPGELRDELNALQMSYEDLYCATAVELGVKEPRQRIPLILTVIEGATRWSDPNLEGRKLKLAADQAVALTRTLLLNAVAFPPYDGGTD